MRIGLILFFLVGAIGCACGKSRVQDQHITVDPIEVRPVEVKVDVTVRDAREPKQTPPAQTQPGEQGQR